MDCGCVNTGISIYFQCRILAAKNNVYLKSRESAAEYFGISVSSLANYERGITVPPLDLIMMMADVYGAPQLKNLYCLEQCPLGKQQPVSAEIKTLEANTMEVEPAGKKSIPPTLLRLKPQQRDIEADEAAITDIGFIREQS